LKPVRRNRAAPAALALAFALAQAAVSVSCERPAESAARRLIGLWMRAAEVVRFTYLPTQRARGAQTLLTLAVFSRGDWDALARALDNAPQGDVVGESTGRVVVAEVPPPRFDPYPAGNPDAKAFAAMRLDAAAVRRALTLRVAPARKVTAARIQ
jgi:hypothetical protein